MKKVLINFWLDAVAFAMFVFMTSTGILIQYSLPQRSGRWSTVWGLSRHEWGELHFYLALALFLTLALHILLHWKWILNLVRGHHGEASGRRLLLGVFALVVVILLATAPVMAPVETLPGAMPGHGGRMH